MRLPDPAFAKADNSNPPELRPVHWILAEERFTKDVELFADWMAECSEAREPSDYWTSISTAELVRTGLSGKCNAEQAKAVLDELRKRFLADQDVEFFAWGLIA